MALVALAQDHGDAVGAGDGAGGGAEDVHDRVERARPRQPFDGADQAHQAGAGRAAAVLHRR